MRCVIVIIFYKASMQNCCAVLSTLRCCAYLANAGQEEGEVEVDSILRIGEEGKIRGLRQARVDP